MKVDTQSLEKEVEVDHRAEAVIAAEDEVVVSRDDQGSSNDTNTTPESSEIRASSPPRRPLTRSQTGRPSKRRVLEDNALDRDSSSPPPVKKSRTYRKRAAQKGQGEVADVPPPAPSSRENSTASSSADIPTLNSNSVTFLDGLDDSNVPSERRGPKSRANLPVPVPNLTKKSRGRRVPTTVVLQPEDLKKDKRTYVCSVEGCGKCFHRGEHLKRHIRSIHTHEKPFKCTYPDCEKFFNRHDNLLQHLKVHTHNKRPLPSDGSADSLLADPAQNETEPAALAASKPLASSSLLAALQQQAFTPSVVARSYALPSEELFTKTNMAVSSVRTEMPQSPPRMSIAQSSVRDAPPMNFHPSQNGSPPLLLPVATGQNWPPGVA
ncbi:uncharacterized protein BT62DRAFT_959770 [Guyanagaster necrorhizus]|uniref:C2H2-type domain-containing protein n=1 Tax=Guyanagaster necrorhizus TaxID=856835 RepID=A0A9P7W3Q6_9AGAR|nr:uncharacterized protein BT62DRAFT_959770 [Guyanagaster necrorhizus MCA 3950]KAG7451870.1 hypothetical protein BT62DRAFT_959770 [Guyanagaster necrorhizus MCA 3950]